MTYAKNTDVSVGQSEQQVKALLRKHGANQIMLAESEDMIGVMFSMKSRQIKFVIPIPSLDDDEVKLTPTGKTRSLAQRKTEAEKILRSNYRLLYLLVKTKLEFIKSKAVTFEDAFLAHTVMANGQTVGEWAKPRIDSMYQSGEMPPLLGGAS